MAETGYKKWIITITVITASLLELIDTTIVNVSIISVRWHGPVFYLFLNAQ